MPGLHGSARPIPGSPWKGPEAFSVPSAWRSPPIWLPDLVQGLGLGCLLVAEAGLGTINQVGLTAAYLHRRGDSLTGHRVEPLSAGEPDARGQPGPV